ncbi:MAG: DUF3662 domain-containing protein [Anaerolineales bacterium]|nr:DUF3662 domain-containing protein [Anaerolineales bacterium]
MKEKFDQIESQLKRFIEESTARLFAAMSVESQLAERLVNAMRSKTEVGTDGTLWAPSIYMIAVHPDYTVDMRSNHALLETLAQTLQEVGEQAGVHFRATPLLTVVPDADIVKGEFQVDARMLAQELPETDVIEIDTKTQAELPARAFLIVGGSHIFSLQDDTINIGRKPDNQLVIDDPRVSRNHAQLRATKGQFHIFDLGSSGGTFINGERVTQAVLHPGDVISLAGVPIVYGQDAVRSISETQEYHPPGYVRSEHTTTNVPLDDLDLDTFQE